MHWIWRKPESNGPKFAGPRGGTPADLIRSFASDYTIWNNHCHANSKAENANRETLFAGFSALYRQFLDPYIANGTPLQGISFGSHSSFDPDRLTIGDTELGDGLASVAFSVGHPILEKGDDFVAELVKGAAGEWRLKQIFYLDPYAGNARLPYL